MTAENLDQLLTETQAADLICYSPRALQNWRLRGGGPPYIKVSARSIRYQRRDILNWVDERRRIHSADQSFR